MSKKPIEIFVTLYDEIQSNNEIFCFLNNVLPLIACQCSRKIHKNHQKIQLFDTLINAIVRKIEFLTNDSNNLLTKRVEN